MPVGFCFDEEDRIIIDPDEEVRGAVSMIFSTFRETGSAYGVTGDIIAAANSSKRLTSGIYKVCGNIHNDDCFKATFKNTNTVNATVSALNNCGDVIRKALRQFG